MIDEDGSIIAGHGRVLAAEKLGLTVVPVMIARGWTVEDRRAYVIWDNQSSLVSSWDNDLLRAEIAELKIADYDVDLLGFKGSELVSFLAKTNATGPEQFPQFSENIATEHCCPKCGYRWSGASNAGAAQQPPKT